MGQCAASETDCRGSMSAKILLKILQILSKENAEPLQGRRKLTLCTFKPWAVSKSRSILGLLHTFPFLLALAITSFAALSGCERSWSWHQRVSVHVQTADGLRSGSSVLRGGIVDRTDALLPDARGASSFLRGEAVIVEIAPGKYLFALLDEMPTVFPVLFPGEAPLQAAKKLDGNTASALVPSKYYPIMVTFDDPSDPSSVRLVDPSNLEASFGPGVTLQSVEMSLTEDPVTFGAVDAVLTWLSEYKRGALRLNGKKCIACPVRSENLADLIEATSFSNEVK